MRIDCDSIGDVELPKDALFSTSAFRAQENFAGLGPPVGAFPAFVRALARVKRAAARANLLAGALDTEIANTIDQACAELICGDHHRHMIVPILEGSGGTSTNMNINEVIANRAGQILGDPLGSFNRVHPNDHVNLSQSTNDVIPTAVKLTCIEVVDDLIQEGNKLSNMFLRKSEEHEDVLRVGRTCMQAAQPMTYGQLFGGYASSISRAIAHLEQAQLGLRVVPLGGTAVGTGLGAVPGYHDHIVVTLSAELGFDISLSEDRFDGITTTDSFCRFSSEVKILAETISKIAADLVILSSDQHSGLGEVILPQVQPGSSIMAGKVNPVICMAVQQVAYVIQGNDTTVSSAALNGQMEINHFEPVIARALFNSIESLRQVTQLFRARCIEGLQVNVERSYENLATSTAISSLFLPVIGYKKVCELVRIADLEKRPFVDVVIQEGLINKGNLDELLRIAARPSST